MSRVFQLVTDSVTRQRRGREAVLFRSGEAVCAAVAAKFGWLFVRRLPSRCQTSLLRGAVSAAPVASVAAYGVRGGVFCSWGRSAPSCAPSVSLGRSAAVLNG